MPTFEQLEIFVAVVSTGSFSAAGRKLQKAQSAISNAIANLEISLGVELFDRSGRYPTLTNDGNFLLRDANLLLEQRKRLHKRALQLNQKVDAKIRLVVEECIPHALFMHILCEFAKRYPSTNLEILYASLHDSEELLLANRVDLGLFTPVKKINKNLRTKKLQSMNFTPVVASNHPLAKRKKLEIADFAQYRQLCITSRSGDHEPEEYIFGGQVWSLENSYIIRDLVLEGVGFSFLPYHLIADDLEKMKLTTLDSLLTFCEDTPPAYLIYDHNKSFGLAGEWLIQALSKL